MENKNGKAAAKEKGIGSVGKTLRLLKQRKSYMYGMLIFAVASILVLYICGSVYRNYRKEMIEKEQEQLLTIARTVGKSLVNYVEEELSSLNLYYYALSEWHSDTQDREAELTEMVLGFLEKKPELYEAVRCYDAEGNLLVEAGEMEYSFSQLPACKEAVICGKHFCEGGWYQMYVAKEFTLNRDSFYAVYAMNLSEIHSQIVAPVVIGQGGYSVVKDSTLSIIMHHAPSMIGMDAIYDRSVQFPQLDLTELFDWLNRQLMEPEGKGIIASYMWDSPELTPEERIVAYTTIKLPGEESWIVNSTLPYEEIVGPIANMQIRLTFMACFVLLAISFFVYLVTKNMIKAEAQRKEISYLKEINEGMEMLRHKEEEIQHYQRIQSLGQMSSHIAHEFNNYLTPVMVYGELLKEDAKLPAEQKELVGGILYSAEQAADLSRRLLDFSRQDSSVTLTRINLSEDIRSVCKMLEKLTPEHIRLSVYVPEGDVYIKGRKGMIEHILMNLGNNAFHAMEQTDKNGTLSIRLETEHVEREGNGKWAALYVTDTGCGISKDAMDKIFEPFYTTKRSGKGTGLGLSVVRNVVTACGGQIEVQSILQVGTTFELYFPCLEEAPEEEEKVGHYRRVLVIDDDERILKSLDAYFKNKKISCKCYDHPGAALSVIQNKKNICDILFVDYAMPPMNGLEFAEVVRKLNPDITIVLMSGMKDPRFEWYLKNEWIDRFILKSELMKELPELFKDGAVS